VAPLLSLVIVGHNKGERSARCLDSLLESTWRPLQVVFVDNGSTDRTREILEEYAPAAAAAGIQFSSLRLPQNTGSIVPRNLALPHCSGAYIGLLDNDVILRTRNIFEVLVQFLDTHPDAGIVTPKFLYPVPPFRIQCAGGGVTREGVCYLLGRGAERDDPAFNHPVDLAWAISACIVMPAAVVRRLGPMDESLSPTGFEDTDYCFRCRSHGLQVVYVPGAEIYHAENTTTFGTRTVRIHAAMRRNQWVFKKRWRHLLPASPSVRDLPPIHIRQPMTPIWALRDLPMTGPDRRSS
jgi:O-antigen biosynthesis protein